MLGAHKVSLLNEQQAICSEQALHANRNPSEFVRSGSRESACPVHLIRAIFRGQRPYSTCLGVDSNARNLRVGRSTARGAVLSSKQLWRSGFSPIKESHSSIRNSASSPVLVASEGPNLEPAGVEITENGAYKLTLDNSEWANVDEDDGAEILIECKNVYKSFGDKHILRGANLKVRVGEAVGIIGPSGTGKSTVLKIMAGLLAPDSGEVVVCGQAREGLISDETAPRLRIGLVFQSAALFDSLTVRENVGFTLYEHSSLPEARIRELVSASLAAVGLKGVEERLPSELSGGMKKRVALARAIISDGKNAEREVVMYDEPTAGLDPIASTVVEDLIRSLHVKDLPGGGQTGQIASYIVVTHQHSTIRRAVDRLLFLHEGKVVWEGTSTEFDTTSNPIVRQFASGSLDGPIRY